MEGFLGVWNFRFQDFFRQENLASIYFLVVWFKVGIFGGVQNKVVLSYPGQVVVLQKQYKQFGLAF